MAVSGLSVAFSSFSFSGADSGSSSDELDESVAVSGLSVAFSSLPFSGADLGSSSDELDESESSEIGVGVDNDSEFSFPVSVSSVWLAESSGFKLLLCSLVSDSFVFCPPPLVWKEYVKRGRVGRGEPPGTCGGKTCAWKYVSCGAGCVASVVPFEGAGELM